MAAYFTGEHFFSTSFMILLLSGAFLAIALVPFWANPSFWRRDDEDDKQIKRDDA